MTALIVIVTGALAFGGLLLLIHLAERKGESKANERVASETAKETKRQANRAVERRTDNDIVTSLRSKAAAKRKRQTSSKR